jgi:hypothetical protein
MQQEVAESLEVNLIGQRQMRLSSQVAQKEEGGSDLMNSANSI